MTCDPHGTGQLAITDANQVVGVRRLNPFGETRGPGGLTGTTGTWPDAHGFIDKPVNPTTGFSHIGARDYDPGLGRFLSTDPVMDPDDPSGWNPYSYASGNPVDNWDPSGLMRVADDLGPSYVPPPVHHTQAASTSHRYVPAAHHGFRYEFEQERHEMLALRARGRTLQADRRVERPAEPHESTFERIHGGGEASHVATDYVIAQSAKGIEKTDEAAAEILRGSQKSDGLITGLDVAKKCLLGVSGVLAAADSWQHDSEHDGTSEQIDNTTKLRHALVIGGFNTAFTAGGAALGEGAGGVCGGIGDLICGPVLGVIGGYFGGVGGSAVGEKVNGFIDSIVVGPTDPEDYTWVPAI